MSDRFDPHRLRDVNVVPLTAFDANDRLAPEPMRALYQRLFEAGMRVFIPCAGSAEFHSLSIDEIVQSVAIAREVIGDEGLILAPVGLQLHGAIETGRRSLEAGADGVMAMPFVAPYLSDEGARDYYLAIAEQLDCPTVIYKKAALPSDALLLELADHPQVVGVKYAVYDVDAFQRIVQEDGGRIQWLCGSAERFAPYFHLAGARGYTSGAGNVCPRLTLRMFAALNRADWDEAMRLQRLILPIEAYRARAGSSFNISFLKEAIRLTGLNFGPPRAPQRQLTESQRREVAEVMQPVLEAEAACQETIAGIPVP
jgi:4-hydroxy-tetrahydrodipicolinate synthase